jgi:hypothetical protein
MGLRGRIMNTEELTEATNTITLDLNDIETLVNFSSEVLIRLAFFGVPDINAKERSKLAHRNVDLLCSSLHKLLKARYNAFMNEYDNLKSQIQESDSASTGPE